MTDEEFTLLKHREVAEYEALQGLVKQTEAQRLKWAATCRLITFEERDRELRRQIAEEEQEKSPIDLKQEREDRMGDMEYDKQVCG